MITGWPYREVQALFPEEVEMREGLSQWEIFQALAWFGYALSIYGIGKYRFWPQVAGNLSADSVEAHLAGIVGEGWPACDTDVQLVSVKAAEGGQHLVVMLRDGTVLDPLHGESKLSDYIEVIWTAGVHPIRPRACAGVVAA